MIGAIAAGHKDTAEAAAQVLRAGGNAFDAALAALAAACVAEPVLASLGGGGFLLAHPQGEKPILYDFFVQTPLRKRATAAVDLRPIQADFGDASQEFHIGLGAAATPGMIKGLFRIHADLCRLPLPTLLAPAIDLARAGVVINSLQQYIATVVEPILRATPEALALHQGDTGEPGLAGVGERVRMTDFANCLEHLAREGEPLFYAGELGDRLVEDCVQGGGHLQQADLRAYQVIKRQPLDLRYRDARLLSNPPPALGGLLIGLSLHQLAQRNSPPKPWRGSDHLQWMADAMAHTQDLRDRLKLQQRIHRLSGSQGEMDELLAEYQRLLDTQAVASRGTTQISILDQAGNLASMTLSNGEGCGHVLAGTGIMINNMLGEQDLNPQGFHQWPENRRMSSMMSPSALELDDGTRIATGSGGSNRIRSAIMQVLSNLLDYRMPVQQAVAAERIHYEAGLLNLEPPHHPDVLEELLGNYPEQHPWSASNLFFGGAHTVLRRPDGELEGAGDPRRGGVFLTA